MGVHLRELTQAFEETHRYWLASGEGQSWSLPRDGALPVAGLNKEISTVRRGEFIKPNLRAKNRPPPSFEERKKGDLELK